MKSRNIYLFIKFIGLMHHRRNRDRGHATSDEEKRDIYREFYSHAPNNKYYGLAKNSLREDVFGWRRMYSIPLIEDEDYDIPNERF